MAKRARRNGQRNGRRRAPQPPPSTLGPNWRTLAIVIVVFLVIAVSVYAYSTRPADKDDDENGNGNNGPPPEKAPDFTVTSIDGEPIALEAFRGKVVVLDLMATWCEPCSRQMEELNQLQAAYPRSQVVILSIGVDATESEQQLRDFKERHFASWRFALDSDDVGTKYDAQSIPTMAVIDKDGNLVWRHSGVATFDTLKLRIDPLI